MLAPFTKTLVGSLSLRRSLSASAHLRSGLERSYSVASSTLETVAAVKDAVLGGSSSRKQRAEGTIASVFASLSGEKAVALPQRFADLKR
jgi:hypothetical protein